MRVWTAAEPEPEAPLCGIVERVATGDARPFSCGDELLAFLGRQVSSGG